MPSWPLEAIRAAAAIPGEMGGSGDPEVFGGLHGHLERGRIGRRGDPRDALSGLLTNLYG